MADGYFDAQAAGTYDQFEAEMFQPEVVEPAVDFLAGLARPGRALELGVGTGRIALPLIRRGIQVEGIDMSSAMVAKLREKEGAERIRVTIGDFATTRLTGTFRLAYLVFNTINNLTTQDAQVACFANVAAHLEPGGYFVIEVGVPALHRLPPGETVRIDERTDSHVGLDEYDTATQRLVSHHYRLVDGRFRLRSIPFRYVWPSELDLMARLAGLTLRERWGSWSRDPFISQSTQHVSVWQRATSSLRGG